MKLIALLAVVMTSSAFAGEYVSRKLNFSPRTHTGGNQYYYNCDFVEDRTETLLEQLGASNVRSRCTGGLNSGMGMPAFARITFDAPVASENGVTETVVIKGWESCELNSEFLNKAIPLLPAVKLVSKRANCNGGRTARWTYTVEITK